MGEFPSGQRGQTVNLLSLTSVVRTHPLPPKIRTRKCADFYLLPVTFSLFAKTYLRTDFWKVISNSEERIGVKSTLQKSLFDKILLFVYTYFNKFLVMKENYHEHRKSKSIF